MSDFVHLNVHSEYSPQGSIRVEELVKQTRLLDMKAAALTDDNLHCAAKFYFTCKENEIKPIIGCQIAAQMSDATLSRVTILAKNNAGYQNLIRLATLCTTSSYAGLASLDKHSEGLIAFYGGVNSGIYETISAGAKDLTIEHTLEFTNIFQEHFFLELQRINLWGQDAINEEIVDMAYGLDIPLVAINNCVFLKDEDVQTHELLRCIRNNERFDGNTTALPFSKEQYLKPHHMMEELFADIPEAYNNVCEIVSLCNLELAITRRTLPTPSLCNKTDLNVELTNRAEEGLKLKLATQPKKDIKVYKTRLANELATICQIGFASYFMIIMELITWAKGATIPIGPGRGSAVGSLAACALGITEIDSVQYNLPFERFINPGRATLPDIDLDIGARSREAAIKHLKEVYGDEHVVQVAAFDTMGAKKALREVGKTLGVAEKIIETVLNFFPNNSSLTLKQALEEKAALRSLFDENEDIRRLYNFAMKVEGYFCQISTHASAVIVSDTPLQEIIPLCLNKDGNILTQFDGTMFEKLGFPKLDILSSQTLDVISDTLENIEKGGEHTPDMANIPLDDTETYELYATGKTAGIFQMGSSGMTRYLKILKPTCFKDLVAMLALYRPGPISSGMVDC